jgi:phenylacetate-CoA ligase
VNIWDSLHECMPRDDIEQLQLERLQATVNRVYKNVVCYRGKFDDAGVIPEDIRFLTDLQKLPFTEKEDLRFNYPYGMFAVPLREVVRIHSSSGTTNKPVVVGYTKNDIRMWTNVVARFMTAAGVTRDDLVQIAFRYGLFTGAFGLHYGAEAIGASVIPTSTGNTEKQITIMQDYKTTVLVCTPSYALTIADRMEQCGVKPEGLTLRVGLFGGEPWSEAIRGEIEKRMRLSATDNYGLSDVIGPGVAGECHQKNGMHLCEDNFIPEIVDPDTGAVLPPGSVGELVLTTITKEACPVIRYRTGDITSLDFTPCECGRTMVRMKKTMGRTDDMLIIRGVNVYPSQIREILYSVADDEPLYQLVVERKGTKDVLTVVVEMTQKIFSMEMRRQRSFPEAFKKRIESVLGIEVTLQLLEPGNIARQEGNIQPIVDKRNP